MLALAVRTITGSKRLRRKKNTKTLKRGGEAGIALYYKMSNTETNSHNYGDSSKSFL
jgi:hypothetical protein